MPAVANAESRKEDALESDSIQLFRGVSVSYDLAGTVMRMVGDYGQYEGALRFNLRDRYFPTIELGLGDAKHEVDAVTGIEAKVRAPYGRIGCDFNVSKNKHDIYRVMVGARYALTSFKTEAYGNVSVPAWGGTVDYSVETDKCFYHWAEFLFSVDAQIWGPVRLGWSVRYRAKLGSSDMGNNSLWYVPGYGKDGYKLGGTFNVIVELGRKNKKI
jgi:hypothetical protein